MVDEELNILRMKASTLGKNNLGKNVSKGKVNPEVSKWEMRTVVLGKWNK